MARGGTTALLLAVALVLTACTGGSGDDEGEGDAVSWRPAPTEVDGLSVLAESDADGFRLHTASGDKEFLPGINLGSTVPTRQPGELDVLTAEDYRRWFSGMADLGIRVVRIYTLHPPAFYDELDAWNRAHPDAPLYLVQGVYLPDESYVEEDRTLYTPAVDDAFTDELRAVSDAVHGDLEREPRPGHASGTWSTDASRWIISWIVGVEWDPEATHRTDRVDADRPYEPGEYFVASDDATATERWIARHMDGLAAAEHERGTSVPIALANWPTTDPLTHPEEPLAQEDLAGVDAEHVQPTDAWPGGTFASYHAYPYYPDFQRHEPGLQVRHDGRTDPYAGYLTALKEHHTSMPVLITEFGVPASLGTAHRGPLGRDQGNHSEQEAMRIDAELLHLIHDRGLSGGFVFSWTDEWFKRTWNTMESQDPTRRQLWHDPLTNEQWFGIVATDSAPVPDSRRDLAPETGPVEYVLAEADASYLHLKVAGRDGVPEQLDLLVDTLPGSGPDYRVRVDTVAGEARAYVRRELEPIRLYTAQPVDLPDADEPWHLFRQIVNRALVVDGERFPAETEDIGNLVEGTWDPEDPDYDSLATWQVLEDHDTVRLRIPWPMVGLADPSARMALGSGRPAELVPIDGLGLTIKVDGATERLDYAWPTWNHIEYTERPLAGIDVLEDAFRDLG